MDYGKAYQNLWVYGWVCCLFFRLFGRLIISPPKPTMALLYLKNSHSDAEAGGKEPNATGFHETRHEKAELPIEKYLSMSGYSGQMSRLYGPFSESPEKCSVS